MDSDATYPDVEGFEIKPINTHLNSKVFRINIQNESDFQNWKNAFCEQTSSTFNIVRTTKETQKAIFMQRLRCQHGIPERKEYEAHKKSYTG